MRFSLCIFVLFAFIFKISSLKDYKLSNSTSRLTDYSLEILRPTNSCRIGIGPNYHNTDSSSLSTGVADLFLLFMCHECLHHIAYKKLPDELLDYRNHSQMQNACYMKKDAAISFSSCLERVKSCCINAELCCKKQLTEQANSSNAFCPTTWDGIACIDQTLANSTIKVICPSFIPNFFGQKLAEKRCLEDGRWSTITVDNITWEPTNYEKCHKWLIENEYLLSQIKALTLILSIIMLLLSLFIYMSFKSLRSQQRIRIHINLFLTLLLKSCFELINTVVIGMDSYSRITDNLSQIPTILQENKEACKWITILLRYFQNSTFCWMLCEALFLYQLLFRTFEHTSNIKMYLGIGWVLPSIYTIIYVLIRKFHPLFKNLDQQCWVEEPPKMEYLMRGPNMIVMLINVILLVNILRLIRNMPVQPSDRSYRKRALKAVLILVPLFGLHFILVAFQIEPINRFYFGYSVIQNLVQDSQGVAVSLAFCAMNQEVLANIKHTFHLRRCISHDSLPRNHSSKRHSNSSRSSDHSRIIPLIPSQIAVIIRRSTDDQSVTEVLKKSKMTEPH